MRLNFDKHLLKTWRYTINHTGWLVLVMRKRGYLWMVRSIVIAKDQSVDVKHELAPSQPTTHPDYRRSFANP